MMNVVCRARNAGTSMPPLNYRSQFRSSLELKTYEQQHQDPRHPNPQGAARKRTPSLPPISTNYDFIAQEDEGREGDTSGYASDNACNEYPLTETWTKQTNNWPISNFTSRKTPESVSSCSGGREEQRARWGDRGVGVGHLWAASPHMPQAPLPQIDRATPSWLQRGLMQEPAQVLVISHEDNYSNSQDNMSRSCETLVSAEEFHKSFLRGQNTPIDPHSLAERERKRQKALEQQNAIKQQLEEKERKRREEEEMQVREERREEERLRRHQELERLRLEEEQKKVKEKEEKEERIAKAMRDALELAERTAREEKARARRKHISERRPPTPKPTVKTVTTPSSVASSEQSEQAEKLTNIEFYKVQPPEPLIVATAVVVDAADAAALVESGNQENKVQQELATASQQEKQSTVANPEPHLAAPADNQQVAILVKPDTPVAPLSPPSKVAEEPSSSPVTLLSPRATSTPQYSAPPPSRHSPSAVLPLTLAIEELSLEPCEIEVSRLGVLASPPGRVLTPSKFRPSVKREQWTQTDQPAAKSRRERRSIRLEDRPKWGVNRPQNQYIKASDRDPHRRVTRTRNRPQPPDSDDSRSPSPMNNSKFSFTSFSPLNRSVNSSVRTQNRTTRGVGTPRVVQILPHCGLVRKSSAGRRYLTIKGNTKINRPITNNILPKRPDIAEFTTVKEVLFQLTALKNGLSMKQKEWDLTRSPTPYSEMSCN